MLTELNEDEWALRLPGMEIPAYGAFIALAAALALACLLVRSRKTGLKSGWAQVIFLICVPCALVLSRALYTLFDASFDFLPARAAVAMWQGGHSMLGALVGACLGAPLAAKALRADARVLLDALAPALLLFVCVARLGESTTALGISKPLMNAPDFFLVEQGEYDAYMRTYLVEAAVALALFFVAVFGAQMPAGERFLRVTLLFCGTQVLMESLRFDGHMRLSFVSVAHVAFMLLFCAALLALALRVRKGKRRALVAGALAAIPVSIGALIALEFALDRSSVSVMLLYAVYIAILAAMSAAGLALQNDWRKSHG